MHHRRSTKSTAFVDIQCLKSVPERSTFCPMVKATKMKFRNIVLKVKPDFRQKL